MDDFVAKPIRRGDIKDVMDRWAPIDNPEPAVAALPPCEFGATENSVADAGPSIAPTARSSNRQAE